MADHWFKARTKPFHYGAEPANWKGWAAVGCFIALLLFFSLILLPWQHGHATAPSAWQIVLWAGLVCMATAAFIALCRAKSDGQWVWRWGK